ncbi:MAG: hypothetical protein ACUVV1_03250 [Fimbriimonadales bacterium]
MPIRFLKNASEIADVSKASPLPVSVERAAPAKPVDTLLIASTTITTTANIDLLGFTNTELPTLDNCLQYGKLLWTLFRTGDAATTYRILARATDHNGAPLANGWLVLETKTLLSVANSWSRVVIPSTGFGYFDQYRIEVWRTDGSDYTLISKIVGVW